MLLFAVDWWTKVASIASGIAAFAAAIALWFARDTVREARRLRHDNARDRVLDCVANHLATLLRGLGSTGNETEAATTATRIRLEAAIAATGDQLPACRALTAGSINLTSAPAVVTRMAEAALREVAAPPPAVRSRPLPGYPIFPAPPTLTGWAGAWPRR